MTGATATGYAVPNLNPIENLVNGSLPQAIYQLSKNQCDLNDMFKEVIMDFQVRLLDNQTIVIKEVVDIRTAIVDITACLKMMGQVLVAMQGSLNELTKTI